MRSTFRLVGLLFLLTPLASKAWTQEAERPTNSVRKEVQAQLEALRSHHSHLESVTFRVKESRLLYYLSKYSSLPEDKESFLESGQKAALAALKEDPSHPDAFIWWSAHTGELAGLKKNLSALRVVSTLEEELLRFKKAHPCFHGGAAHRALAMIYYNAPPIISVGSDRKAKNELDLAIACDAQHPLNLLLMAQYLWEEEDDDDLETQKQVHLLSTQALNLLKDEQFRWDRPLWKKQALELIEEVKLRRAENED